MPEAAAATVATEPLHIGRYALFDELAAGGMATVHLGRLLAPGGVGRTVAVKRLHAHFLKDPEFITMFMDEARIASRIVHPNVVPMVDVVHSERGLFLIMEYVHGESLSRLMRSARKANEPIPPRIVAAIMHGVLLRLDADQVTERPDGTLLGVVHRDVSPQNVMVGADGAARVFDFGIAKAAGRAQITRQGQIKGKLAYMAPEQIRGQADRRTDVFAASVVLWEMLAGRRLHEGSKDVDIVTRVVKGQFGPPSEYAKDLSPELDALVLRGLATDVKKRFASALELATELEAKAGLASPSDVSAWVERFGKDVLAERANLVSAMEIAAETLVLSATIPPSASVATASPEGPPSQGDIPVHVEPPHANSGEVPSGSAVFAHAQAVPAGAPAPRAPRRLHRNTLAVFALSCALAVIGLVFGAVALLRRSPPPSPMNAPSPPVMLSASLAPPGASSASSPAIAPVDEPVDLSADEPVAAASAPPAPSVSGAVSPSASSAPTTNLARTGSPRPAFNVKSPATKSKCDPPFTVDRAGHRKYKPECMGL